MSLYDTAMCLAHDCASRHLCLRYTATIPEKGTTIGGFRPEDKYAGLACKHFWSNTHEVKYEEHLSSLQRASR